MSTATPPAIRPRLLVVLALLASVAPFATDLYLSAFPLMATDLRTGAATIQLTLTAILLGLAVGQLVFGPLSDRFGRRGPLLIGAAVFVAASVAAAVAPTIEVLLVARLLQGLSGAAGMVIGRAVIADLEKGDAAARAFSLMMLVGGIAPVIAPLAGSFLVDTVGWRGVLGVLALIAVAMLLGTVFVVRESLPRERRGARGAGGASALRTRAYIGAAATFVFGFSVMMAYISASPFVYQDVMGMTPVAYGIAFGVNALGLAATSALGARVLRTRTPRFVLGLGAAGMLIGTAALLLLVIFGAPAIWLTVPLFVSVASLGFVMGPATAIALAAVPRASGLASAVLGAAQFGMATVVSPLVGLGGSESVLPMAIVMLALAVLAGLAYVLGVRTAPESLGVDTAGSPVADAAVEAVR